jgi:hypothetical protein
MSSQIKVTVLIERDGALLPGFPLVRRLTVDEAQSADTEQASSASYVAFPSNQLDTIQLLLIRADQATSIRFNNQSDAGLPLNANGFVIVVDSNIASGIATNCTIQNNSGSTANLKGVACGT